MGKKYSKQGKVKARESRKHVRSIAQLFNTRCRNYMFNNTPVRSHGVWLVSVLVLISVLFLF